MKQIHFKFLLIVSLFFLTAGVFAEPKAYAFSSGSTGADGALEPTQNVELTVPENGTFNYTTINIPTRRDRYFQEEFGQLAYHHACYGRCHDQRNHQRERVKREQHKHCRRRWAGRL